MNNMKMYVWEKVLRDYGYGKIVIHARTITEARAIALTNNLQNEIRTMKKDKWIWVKPTKVYSGKGCVQCHGSA